MAKKFIVAVIGTANTGKTTFKNDVIERFASDETFFPFTTNEIDYREKIKAEGLQINRNGNLRSQKIIFDCLAESVVKAAGDPSVRNFISDRSVIDAYVYTKYLMEHNPESGITRGDLSDMMRSLEYFVRLYDTIIFFPLEDCQDVKVVDDNFRDTDLSFRTEIDRIFRNVLDDLLRRGHCRYVDAIKGSREERVRRFVDSFSFYPPLLAERGK